MQEPVPPPTQPPTCTATLRGTGEPCKYPAKNGELCGIHSRCTSAAAAQHLEECSVCLDCVKPRQRKELACGHVFHRKCVRRWFSRGRLTCPMCRAPCLTETDMATLSDRLGQLLGENPAPAGIHFAMHIMALMNVPEVQEALGLTQERLQLVVEVLYQSFSVPHFLHNVRLVGM